MAGYFEQYGVSDAKRSKAIAWISGIVLGLVIAVLAGYFVFRTFPAKRQVGRFLDDLRRQDYKAAYNDWGCARGCPDYAYKNFLEDWGPKSGVDAASASIRRSRFCGDFVNVIVESNKGPLFLRYDREPGSLGFAPWQAACTAHVPTPGAP